MAKNIKNIIKFVRLKSCKTFGGGQKIAKNCKNVHARGADWGGATLGWGGGNSAVGGGGGAIGGRGQHWGRLQPLRAALHTISISLQNSLS